MLDAVCVDMTKLKDENKELYRIVKALMVSREEPFSATREVLDDIDRNWKLEIMPSVSGEWQIDVKSKWQTMNIPGGDE
jgi:hypothetical protein